MVLKIAHRGASNYAPENTIEAFKKAVEMEIDIVEFDVHRTKDGKLVVMHDFDVSRTTDGTGLIRNLLFEDLRKFCGPNGEVIPTFHEVIDILKDKCILKIDVYDIGMEEDLINIIKKNNLENSVIITSKILSVLKKFKQKCPEIKTEAGEFINKIVSMDKMIRRAKSVNADIISPFYKNATKESIKIAHENGFEVHVWPVNDNETIERMKDMGVDGITSKSWTW